MTTTPSSAATPDDRERTPWEPRKATAGGTISAGDEVGIGADRKLRRYWPGQMKAGIAEETILDDWDVVERARGRWVPVAVPCGPAP